MAQIKADAQAAGRYYAPSGAQGYHIILKTTGNFDIKKINALMAPPGSCTNAASLRPGSRAARVSTTSPKSEVSPE